MNTLQRSKDTFINCPFDPGYRPIFHAIVFCVHYLGFVPRCALEEDDGSEYRLAKIQRIIEECELGINDLSAVDLDPFTGLPRFNMPLELGLFLGCKRYGPEHQSKKRAMILDSEPFRYRQFISDISGQDIRYHNGDPERAIREVRDWLQASAQTAGLPGGGDVVGRYRQFENELDRTCASLALEPGRLTFIDLSAAIRVWLASFR